MMKMSGWTCEGLSLIHISEPTRLGMISYAVFCLKKKKYLGQRLCACRRARLRTGRQAHVVRAWELSRDRTAGERAGHGGPGEPGRLSRPHLSRRRARDR